MQSFSAQIAPWFAASGIVFGALRLRAGGSLLQTGCLRFADTGPLPTGRRILFRVHDCGRGHPWQYCHTIRYNA